MEEELSVMWGKFSLREEEQAGVSLETSEIVPLVTRGKDCLVGKLLADRIVPREYFKAPLRRAWRTAGAVTINVIGENMFIAEFEHASDKSRIMEGKPWLFDGNLVSLAEFDGLTPPSDMNFDMASFWVRMYNMPLDCKGKEVGQKIGALVGTVEEVDISEAEADWGEFLRVKISFDLTKPLARSRMLHAQHRSIWVAFKYEKLPKFCYNYGVIKHDRRGCSMLGNRRPPGHEDALPYGYWLSVVFPVRRGGCSYFKPERGRARDRGSSSTQKEPSSNSGSNKEALSRAETTSEDGGADVMRQNPSQLPLATDKASQRQIREVLNADDSYMQAEYVSKEVSLEGEKESRNEINGKDHYLRKSEKETPKDSSGHISGPNPQKYFGLWDSVKGRMTWQPEGEDCEIQLEKDPVSHTYHPRVLSRKKGSGVEKPNFVFLTETKLLRQKVEAIRSKLGFDSVFVVDCKGRSGGLALTWNSEVQVVIQNYSFRHINAQVQRKVYDVQWKLTCFYGHPDVAKRLLGIMR